MVWSPLLNQITAAAESGNRDFDKYGRPIRSPKGAMYAMQVMPGTSRDPGFGVKPASDNSPEEFNRVGRDYRDAMFNRYGNDPAKGWAAYNWGPGNLDRALKQHGESWLAHAPTETQKYVRQNVSALGGNNVLQPRKPRPQQTLADIAQQPMQRPSFAEAVMPPIMGEIADPMGTLKPAKPKFFSKDGAGPILLAGLGDALSALSQQPARFLPMIQNARNQEQERQFDRERWDQELAMKREAMMAKANEPPQWLQDAQTFAQLPDEQRQMVTGYRDAMYPVLADYVDGQGNTRKGVYSRSEGGFAGQGGPRAGVEEDGYIFMGGDPADPKNWKAR